jgi:hypothetical protein
MKEHHNKKRRAKEFQVRRVDLVRVTTSCSSWNYADQALKAVS